jgi:hypothetical protein
MALCVCCDHQRSSCGCAYVAVGVFSLQILTNNYMYLRVSLAPAWNLCEPFSQMKPDETCATPSWNLRTLCIEPS